VPKTGEYMDEIIEYLFVGGVRAYEENWKQFDIIVNCTKSIPRHDANKCICIPVNDDPDECQHLLQYIEDSSVLQKIHQAICDKKYVLVHCHAGSQRSCALVACYLIQYCQMLSETAMDHIRMRRPIAFFGGANFKRAIQQFYFNLS
jgi:protein-tyrosine phosphatase